MDPSNRGKQKNSVKNGQKLTVYLISQIFSWWCITVYMYECVSIYICIHVFSNHEYIIIINIMGQNTGVCMLVYVGMKLIEVWRRQRRNGSQSVSDTCNGFASVHNRQISYQLKMERQNRRTKQTRTGPTTGISKTSRTCKPKSISILCCVCVHACTRACMFSLFSPSEWRTPCVCVHSVHTHVHVCVCKTGEVAE